MNSNHLLGAAVFSAIVAISNFPSLRLAYLRRRRQKKRMKSEIPQIPLAKVRDKRCNNGIYTIICESYDEDSHLKKLTVRVSMEEYLEIDRDILVGLSQRFCAFSGDKKIPGYKVVAQESKPVFSPVTP